MGPDIYLCYTSHGFWEAGYSCRGAALELGQLLWRQQPLAHNERQDAAMQELQQAI